jgi:hypothetical protein
VLRALYHIGGAIKAVLMMVLATRGGPGRSTAVLPAVISKQDAESPKVITAGRATAPPAPSPTPLRSLTCRDIAAETVEKLKAKGFDWSDVF